MSSRVRADFHAHLDGCEQCANHPFELCSEGARLLELAAAEVAVDAEKIADHLIARRAFWRKAPS